MTQLSFYDAPGTANAHQLALCAVGQHGRLREAPARFCEASVSVDESCDWCGHIVATVSWTLDAWQQKFVLR